MTLARDKLSLYGWHFCTAILKLIHNSKKLQTGHEHYPRYSMFSNTFDLAVTLTFDLRTWLLYATHCLYMVDISAQLYWNSFIIQKILQTGHEHYPPYFMFLNTFDLAVTLTFDLRTWLLHATHRLYMVDISAQLYWNSFIIKKKLQTGHEHDPPYSMFLNTFDLAVTLTFDLRTWLLYATHRLYVFNICAKSFGDQVLGGKIMARTRKCHWRTDRRTDTDGQTKQKLYVPEKFFFGGIKT